MQIHNITLKYTVVRRNLSALPYRTVSEPNLHYLEIKNHRTVAISQTVFRFFLEKRLP
jgi:hypothetical protein